MLITTLPKAGSFLYYIGDHIIGAPELTNKDTVLNLTRNWKIGYDKSERLHIKVKKSGNRKECMTPLRCL